jgi:hypothetical protein
MLFRSDIKFHRFLSEICTVQLKERIFALSGKYKTSSLLLIFFYSKYIFFSTIHLVCSQSALPKGLKFKFYSDNDGS